MKSDLSTFILQKNKRGYILTCNGNFISEKQFISDLFAIEYFRNYITSFMGSILKRQQIARN